MHANEECSNCFVPNSMMLLTDLLGISINWMCVLLEYNNHLQLICLAIPVTCLCYQRTVTYNYASIYNGVSLYLY